MRSKYLKLVLGVVVLILGIVLALYFLILLGGVEETLLTVEKVGEFVLESSAFRDGGEIPEKYTCEGLDISPPLSWRDYPAQTISFAIMMEDPDAPGGIFTHWIIFNIPPDVSSLDEGVPKVKELPNGVIQGRNDFGRIGYGGPCPPPGSTHHYIFKVIALDTKLELNPGVDRNTFLNTVKGHIIAEGKLTGIYGR